MSHSFATVAGVDQASLSGYHKLAPIHPGEVLAADFLEPLGLSQYRPAMDISVPARRVNEIVHGTRAISADTALQLARYLGTSDRLWLNLQARYASRLSAIISALGWRRKFASSTGLANPRCSGRALCGLRSPAVSALYWRARR